MSHECVCVYVCVCAYTFVFVCVVLLICMGRIRVANLHVGHCSMTYVCSYNAYNVFILQLSTLCGRKWVCVIAIV